MYDSSEAPTPTLGLKREFSFNQEGFNSTQSKAAKKAKFKDQENSLQVIESTATFNSSSANSSGARPEGTNGFVGMKRHASIR